MGDNWQTLLVQLRMMIAYRRHSARAVLNSRTHGEDREE
jgi:hypothetical protein